MASSSTWLTSPLWANAELMEMANSTFSYHFIVAVLHIFIRGQYKAQPDCPKPTLSPALNRPASPKPGRRVCASEP
eukprot:1188551-Prorocentrum_minimum.AAC.3